jgi:hypothetical protein
MAYLRKAAKSILVTIRMAGDCPLVAPQAKPRYSLDELLAQCDPAVLPSAEERAWVEMSSVGREL